MWFNHFTCNEEKHSRPVGEHGSIAIEILAKGDPTTCNNGPELLAHPPIVSSFVVRKNGPDEKFQSKASLLLVVVCVPLWRAQNKLCSK